MTGLSRPETATQMRASHQQQRLRKRRYRPLPTKPDSRRARPPTRAFFLDEQEIFARRGRSSVRRSSSILSFLRSEEHTSELQSQSNLVCRLLLEKKKKTEHKTTTTCHNIR